MAVTTRAKYEAVLIRRLGASLTAASLDGTTVNGTNADLNDPLGYATRKLGGTVSDVSSVVDADLSTISSDFGVDALLDVAELRTLENILGNYTLVDISAGPERESLSQVATATEKRAERLSKKIEKEYGIGGAEFSTGVLTLNFATKGDDPEITV
jgi:hypothetical protein